MACNTTLGSYHMWRRAGSHADHLGGLQPAGPCNMANSPEKGRGASGSGIQSNATCIRLQDPSPSNYSYRRSCFTRPNHQQLSMIDVDGVRSTWQLSAAGLWFGVSLCFLAYFLFTRRQNSRMLAVFRVPPVGHFPGLIIPRRIRASSQTVFRSAIRPSKASESLPVRVLAPAGVITCFVEPISSLPLGSVGSTATPQTLRETRHADHIVQLCRVRYVCTTLIIRHGGHHAGIGPGAGLRPCATASGGGHEFDALVLLLAQCRTAYLTRADDSGQTAVRTHIASIVTILLLDWVLSPTSGRSDDSSPEYSSSTGELSMKPLVWPCRTTHTRLFPKKHSFAYSYLLVGVPVDWQGSSGSLLSSNTTARRCMFHVDAADHLEREQGVRTLRQKLDAFLRHSSMDPSRFPHAYLVTAPRCVGYCFNPVSFWYLYGPGRDLEAMILEVNNTFDERRMYLLDTSSTKRQGGFASAWQKDFHVSPFNDREGSYTLKATDPRPFVGEATGVVNNDITLLSAGGQAKLVARVFSVSQPLGNWPEGLADRTTFVLAWAWVGLLTFPRIVRQAGQLYFQHALRVWFRPEVAPSSIGRRASEEERVLETFFARFLEQMTLTATRPMKVVYQRPSDLGGEAIVEYHSSAEGAETTLQVRVLSPGFYSRFVHYSHVAEAFDREYLCTDERNRSVWISDPALLGPLLGSRWRELALPLKDHTGSGWVDGIRWAVVRRLRCPPAAPSYGERPASRPGATVASTTDIRAKPGIAAFDEFAAAQADAWRYRRATVQLFAGQRLLGGLAGAAWMLDMTLRIAVSLAGWQVQCHLGAARSSSGITWTGQVVGVNVGHGFPARPKAGCGQWSSASDHCYFRSVLTVDVARAQPGAMRKRVNAEERGESNGAGGFGLGREPRCAFAAIALRCPFHPCARALSLHRACARALPLASSPIGGRDAALGTTCPTTHGADRVQHCPPAVLGCAQSSPEVADRDGTWLARYRSRTVVPASPPRATCHWPPSTGSPRAKAAWRILKHAPSYADEPAVPSDTTTTASCLVVCIAAAPPSPTQRYIALLRAVAILACVGARGTCASFVTRYFPSSAVPFTMRSAARPSHYTPHAPLLSRALSLALSGLSAPHPPLLPPPPRPVQALDGDQDCPRCAMAPARKAQRFSQPSDWLIAGAPLTRLRPCSRLADPYSPVSSGTACPRTHGSPLRPYLKQPTRSSKDSSRHTISAMSSANSSATATPLVNRRRLSSAISSEDGSNVKLTRTGRPSKALKGQAVHTCEDCGKVYTRAEHMRYACNALAISLSLSHCISLTLLSSRRHQRTHSSGLTCDEPGCDRTFNRSDMLQRHKEKHHSSRGGSRRQSACSRASNDRSSRSPLPSSHAQQPFPAMRSSFAPAQSQAFEVHGMFTPSLGASSAGLSSNSAPAQWGSVSLSPMPSTLVSSSMSYPGSAVAQVPTSEPYPGGYGYSMSNSTASTDAWYSPGLSSVASPSINSSSMPSAWGSTTSLNLAAGASWENPTPFGTLDPSFDAMQPPAQHAGLRKRDFDAFTLDPNGGRDSRFRKFFPTRS
ncbi:hypothetical protein FH972_022511 [Carpinus fangiana]|uniref:C2H2-type domain-containing protein n=1 Tax=Carpinus fangiana TaxID=176857 RepID=A0A5N6KSF5_9ROSI|nr:hypothetical protein FH972_022511 [Carpinus fangiana]